MTAQGVVEEVIAEELGGHSLSVDPIDGGYSAAGVYRVRARLPQGERELVVKTAPVHDTPADDETRVYGTHPDSLGATHELLRRDGLPTYELLGWGRRAGGAPIYWVAMSLLDGVSVRGHRPHVDPEAFQWMCGEALGAMHSVTRPYDGPVDLESGHSMSWDEAFFAAFEEVIAREVDRRDLDELATRVRAFVKSHQRLWTTVEHYSLSHVDSLQGHAARGPTGWRYLGHVDLEDVVFLDARFALAGYELGTGGRAPTSFWEGYTSVAPVDPSYPELRPILQLFYLVAWLWLDEPRDDILARIAAIVAAR